MLFIGENEESEENGLRRLRTFLKKGSKNSKNLYDIIIIC